MASTENAPDTQPGRDAPPAWSAWLAWGWVALVVLAAVAIVGGFLDLVLALDVQRHLR